MAPFIYAQDIKSFKGPAKPYLNTLKTAAMELDTLVALASGERARLDTGPADPGDPGHVAPPDYNATVNNKHWKKIL